MRVYKRKVKLVVIESIQEKALVSFKVAELETLQSGRQWASLDSFFQILVPGVQSISF